MAEIRAATGYPSLVEQLTRLNAAVLICTMLLTLLLLAATSWFSAHDRRLQQAQLHAGQLALNLSPSLVFQDKQAAQRELQSLHIKHELQSVLVLDANGQPFAQTAGRLEPVWSAASQYEERRSRLLQVKTPVLLQQEQVGSVIWTEQLQPMQLTLLRLFAIALLISAVAVLIAIRVSMHVQRQALAPVLDLAALAEYAAEHQDYSVRGTVRHRDEIGRLTERFNELLKRTEIWQQNLTQSLRQSQQQNQALDLLAHRDALTGLHNRLSFETLLPKLLHTNAVALMFIDLDNFKTVNDVWGHDAGDEVLQQVARRMQQQLRSADTLFRLGGDEFAILLPGLNEQATAERLAARLIDAISHHLYVKSALMPVGATIGIAFYPSDATDAASLLHHADLAMYSAKKAGKNTWRFYAA